jgi:hypothetical protein
LVPVLAGTTDVVPVPDDFLGVVLVFYFLMQVKVQQFNFEYQVRKSNCTELSKVLIHGI